MTDGDKTLIELEADIAVKALDRVLNLCEEIDLHLPEEERTGYKMYPDIILVRDTLYRQKATIEKLTETREPRVEDQEIKLLTLAYTHEELARKYILATREVMHLEKDLKKLGIELTKRSIK